ncbi:potassium channel family protein [Gilvimarinus xylanilyticus]|uniref:Potassium channel family protein n=1 Tax=Gilvimarinus xylanilyticus TaxID=2944139 RepID=A0A9X2KSM7_9GAMM|nr:potassium channel family protein [Gilvimarinus xylanilyticus]MCP8897973.1 potassium channel family protein [Gilvimarinus xylanilyticus]
MADWTNLQAWLGAAIIIFTLFDAFVTILSLRGGGPLTTFVSRRLWGAMLAVHRFSPCHKLLSASGPVLLIVVVLIWYSLLYVGWFLVFRAAGPDLTDSTTLTAANDLQRLYFTGVTLSGLGYGDYTAQHFPWTLFSTLAVATGTLLTSLGLSYIIAVVPVALEKRQNARQINALIGDQAQALERLYNKDDVTFLWDKLFAIQLNSMRFSTKYGAYPVVAYFHAAQVQSAFSLAYLKAADVLFYIVNHPNPDFRPSPSEVIALKRLLASHSDNIREVIDGYYPKDRDIPARLAIDPRIQETESDNFSWAEYQSLRYTLALACLYDGW